MCLNMYIRIQTIKNAWLNIFIEICYANDVELVAIVKGNIAPVLNQLSTTPSRRMRAMDV
jgi:hypothetical protein